MEDRIFEFKAEGHRISVCYSEISAWWVSRLMLVAVTNRNQLDRVRAVLMSSIASGQCRMKWEVGLFPEPLSYDRNRREPTAKPGKLGISITSRQLARIRREQKTRDEQVDTDEAA